MHRAFNRPLVGWCPLIKLTLPRLTSLTVMVMPFLFQIPLQIFLQPASASYKLVLNSIDVRNSNKFQDLKAPPFDRYKLFFSSPPSKLKHFL